MDRLLSIKNHITTPVKTADGVEWWPFGVQESSSMLQMASVYGIQQTAKHAPAFFVPKCDEVSVHCSVLRFKPRHKTPLKLTHAESPSFALGLEHCLYDGPEY